MGQSATHRALAEDLDVERYAGYLPMQKPPEIRPSEILAGNGAGSLIPTPGGTGAVEAALVAGLTATGLPLPVAAAAALLARLESVWLPAPPGWWAMRTLRRQGLL